METIRKTPTKREMIEQLQRGGVSLPPLSFRLLQRGPEIEGDFRFDALVEASWGEIMSGFVMECKTLSTPKAFENGVSQLKTYSRAEDYLPMLFLPFLSEQQLHKLEQEEISGIDLCGNGVVIVPGLFAVFRSGQKNRFTSSAPIKNIYRKNSSMAAQVFLLCPDYEMVKDVWAEINRRNLLVKRWDKKTMSLSTVSKALKTLEEDLIVARDDTIHLMQPDKLLQKLSENYTRPTITKRVRVKVPEGAGEITQLLQKESQALGLPLVATGMSSVGRYAVMQRGDLFSIYCPRLEMILEKLPGDQADRFPNLELLETVDERVYFDGREEGNFWWASPVQVYLELIAGDKRDQETAQQVKLYIMQNLETVQP